MDFILSFLFGKFLSHNDVVKVDSEVINDKTIIKWNATRKISCELHVIENDTKIGTPIIVNKCKYEFQHKPARKYEFLVNVVGSNIQVSSESVFTSPTKIQRFTHKEDNVSINFSWADLNKVGQNVQYCVKYTSDDGEQCININKIKFRVKKKELTSLSDLKFEVAAVSNLPGNKCGEYSKVLVKEVGKLTAQCYLFIQGNKINIAYFAKGVNSEHQYRYWNYNALNFSVIFYPGCEYNASLSSQIHNSIFPETISLRYEDLLDRGYIDCAYTLITDSKSDVMLKHTVKSETDEDIKQIDFIWGSNQTSGSSGTHPALPFRRDQKQVPPRKRSLTISSGFGSSSSSEEDETCGRQVPRGGQSTPKKLKGQGPALREKGNSASTQKTPGVGDTAGTSNSGVREFPAVNNITNTNTTNAAVINQCDSAANHVDDSHMNIGGSHYRG